MSIQDRLSGRSRRLKRKLTAAADDRNVIEYATDPRGGFGTDVTRPPKRKKVTGDRIIIKHAPGPRDLEMAGLKKRIGDLEAVAAKTAQSVETMLSILQRSETRFNTRRREKRKKSSDVSDVSDVSEVEDEDGVARSL
jgi:hypothetical protein